MQLGDVCIVTHFWGLYDGKTDFWLSNTARAQKGRKRFFVICVNDVLEKKRKEHPVNN
jgi:hypothetical protein